jgi:hypothetical protein
MILLTGWQKLGAFVFNPRSRIPKLRSDMFGWHERETKFSWLVWSLVIWTRTINCSNFGAPTSEGQTNCEEIGICISYWPINYKCESKFKVPFTSSWAHFGLVMVQCKWWTVMLHRGLGAIIKRGNNLDLILAKHD